MGTASRAEYRDGVHTADPSDLMRRMVKEEICCGSTGPTYSLRGVPTPSSTSLSPREAHLYIEVTDYVREEMNRVERREVGRRQRLSAGSTWASPL